MIIRGIDAAAELTVGEPFEVLAVGAVYSRYTGKELEGNITDVQQLHEMVRYFERVQKPSREWPVIDIEHKTAPGPLKLLPAHPLERLPIGGVVDMRVDGEALVVTPAWTDFGLEVKDKAAGLWHPSSVYHTGDAFDPATGERVAGAMLQGFGLTTTPATRPDQLGQVRSAPINDSIPAAKAASQEEVRGMTRAEFVEAYRAMSDEDKAAILEEVAPAPAPEERAEEMDDLQERAAQAEAAVTHERNTNAELISRLDVLTQQVASLTEDKRLNARAQACAGIVPHMRSVAEAVFDAQGAEGVERLFAQHKVDTGVTGKDGQPREDAPPADEAGFTAYVKRNQGEGENFAAALNRIKAAFPDKYRAAALREGVTRA